MDIVDREKFDHIRDRLRMCHRIAVEEVGDRTVRQVAKDLDLTETALREWVQRADVDAGKGPPGAVTTEERSELLELRKRVKRLEMEREILKKPPRHRVVPSGRPRCR